MHVCVSVSVCVCVCVCECVCVCVCECVCVCFHFFRVATLPCSTHVPLLPLSPLVDEEQPVTTTVSLYNTKKTYHTYM